MIKLPDFSQCVEVQQLLFSMGVKHIEELPLVEFKRKVEHKVLVTVKNTEQLRYAQKLKLSAVSLGRGETFTSNHGLIEVNGLKACVYIKDQRLQNHNDEISKYRFHLCWCYKIEEMANSGRKSRYVATARDDGLFPVNNQYYGGNKEKLISLDLCKFCKRMLEEQGMYFYPFSLSEFYKKYQTHIADTFTREELHVSEEQYAPDHHEIAKKYKEAAKYKCQLCGVDCSNEKNLLHLHHIDGNGQNNKHNNLRVLCVSCHSIQPMHSHMKNNQGFQRNMEKLNILRKEQGIRSLNN